MTAIEITCTPGAAILQLSADDVAALDQFAQQLAHTNPRWRIDVHLPGIGTLTAQPAPERTETDQ